MIHTINRLDTRHPFYKERCTELADQYLSYRMNLTDGSKMLMNMGETAVIYGVSAIGIYRDTLKALNEITPDWRAKVLKQRKVDAGQLEMRLEE